MVVPLCRHPRACSYLPHTTDDMSLQLALAAAAYIGDALVRLQDITLEAETSVSPAEAAL
jgi:hypothetical protein